MALIVPNTTVAFLNVPFDPDYENTMIFDDVSAQNLYMENHTLMSISNNSYQRRGKGIIRVGWVADETDPKSSVIYSLYNANYMRFKNTNYENKWFYAFVDRVEYVNNNTVDVFYTTDVMQTWLFDYYMEECFIERQHTETDILGENTVPEGLETGEYLDTPAVCTFGTHIGKSKFTYSPAVCLVTTFDYQGQYAPGSAIHGLASTGTLFSGLYYSIWKFDPDDTATFSTNLQAINDTLEAISGNVEVITESGVKIPRFLADGVVALFMMPWEFAGSITGGTYATPHTMQFDVRDSGVYKLGDYTVTNNKLMCYPYNLLYVSNNQGGDAELRWEDFRNPESASVRIWGNVSPNGGLILQPFNYKNYPNDNPDEALQLSGFPMCSWSNDAYKAWVAQNAGTIIAGVFGLAGKWATVLTPLASYMMFGSSQGLVPSGMGNSDTIAPTGGLIGATLAAVGQVFDHERKAPQAHGNANSSLIYQAGLLTFSFYKKHIKPEYARIIDAYFNMYGYKVNRVGVPNRMARPCYTYLKTVGCAIAGNVPADDKALIQAIYDKGIRFWKTTAVFGVYAPNVNNNKPV